MTGRANHVYIGCMQICFIESSITYLCVKIAFLSTGQRLVPGKILLGSHQAESSIHEMAGNEVAVGW